jgi:hypothetical protein
MPKLNPTTRAWLKGIHILFTAIWLGACSCSLLIQFAFRPTEGGEIYATNSILKMLDDTLIAPSAICSVLTGTLICWLTPWGFFKWRWVTLKWILSVGVILTGSLLVGPSLNGMTEIADRERSAALQNATYTNYSQMVTIFSIPVVAGLVAAGFLTVSKPGGRKKSATKP